MSDSAAPVAVALETRVVIAVSGPEAIAFLQGLVTLNVEALAVGSAGHGALLTPQGKVQFDFIAVRNAEDGILLDVDRGTAAEFMKRLMFYRLRAQVEIKHLASIAVYALLGEPTQALPGHDLCFADPRHEAIGYRAFIALEQVDAILSDAGFEMGDLDDYHAKRIAAGIPEAPFDFEYGQVFAHDIGLDQTGGVDFSKGCFVGQEVVSRMKHRGTARRRVVKLGFDGEAPHRGADLKLDDARVGEMGSSARGTGLAIIRIDRAATAFAGTPLVAGDTELQVSLPPGVSYGPPEDHSSPQAAADRSAVSGKESAA